MARPKELSDNFRTNVIISKTLIVMVLFLSPGLSVSLWMEWQALAFVLPFLAAVIMCRTFTTLVDQDFEHQEFCKVVNDPAYLEERVRQEKSQIKTLLNPYLLPGSARQKMEADVTMLQSKLVKEIETLWFWLQKEHAQMKSGGLDIEKCPSLDIVSDIERALSHIADVRGMLNTRKRALLACSFVIQAMQPGPYKRAAIRQACFEYRHLRMALDRYYANGWECPQVQEQMKGDVTLSGQAAAIPGLDNATQYFEATYRIACVGDVGGSEKY